MLPTTGLACLLQSRAVVQVNARKQREDLLVALCPFFFLQCLPSKYGLKKRSIIRRFFGSNVCLPNRRGSDCFRQASVPWVGIKEAVKDGGLMEKEQNAVCSGL